MLKPATWYNIFSHLIVTIITFKRRSLILGTPLLITDHRGGFGEDALGGPIGYFRKRVKVAFRKD